MSESSKEQAQRLQDWITSNGGLIQDVALTVADPVKGRKVVATKAIPKGTVIIKVPTSICPVASPTKAPNKDAAASEGAQPLADFLASQRKLTPFLRLVLTVLHEYSLGSASKLAPFIESLPTSHNCVLGWNAIEKSALRGTTVEAEASVDIKSTFESIVAPILRSKPEEWQGEWATFEAFQRVCGVVQSRTFHLEANNWLTGASSESTELYMIPAIDMVNHSTDPSARNTSLHRRDESAPAPAAPEAPTPAAPEAAAPAPAAPEAPAPQEGGPPPAEGAENNGPAAPAEAPPPAPAAALAPATTSFFTMEADKDIAEGQELLHTYGDLSDAELLNIFGFVDTLGTSFTNPNNLVHLPTETLVALCQEQKSGRRLGKNFKRKKDFLKDVGLLPEGFPVTASDPLPDSLITVTQILLMSDQSEFEDLRLEMQKAKKKGNSLALLGKETLDETEHSMFVCTNLLRTIEEQLESFPNVPDTLEGADATRAAQAAHVRAGERELVQRQKKELVKLMMSLQSDAEPEDDEEELEEDMEEED